MLRVFIRYTHVLAATAWVGGSIFYLVALQPNLPAEGERGFLAGVNRRFGDLVHLCSWVLAASGLAVTFDRLTNARLTAAYVLILAVKVALAIAMFYLAWTLRSRSSGRRLSRREPSGVVRISFLPWIDRWGKGLSPSRLILVFGIVVLLLGAVLATLYERGLRAL